MIDNNKIILDNIKLSDIKVKSLIKGHQFTTYTDNNNFSTYSFDISNLRIKVNANKITISGSLPKYFFGTNLYDLKFVDYSFLIQKLSDDIGYDIKYGKLTKIEIGKNIILDSPIENYLTYLLYTPYLSTSCIKGTLYFNSTYRNLKFYNKIAEIEQNFDKNGLQFNIPNFDLLRYELTLKKSPYQTLGYNLTLNDLTDFNKYKNLCDILLSEFKGIKSNRIWNVPCHSINSPTDFANFCMIEILNQEKHNYHANNLNSTINKLDMMGLLAGKDIKNRIRNSVHKVYNSTKFTDFNPYMNELNNKVELYLTSYI